MTFVLDDRLARDTFFVADLPLSQIRAMDDRRYPWLVLVPRRAAVTALDALAPPDRTQLSVEADLAARVLRADDRVARLNVASLGNIVAQLHLHVVGRWPGDPAWPGPVWGHSPAEPYAAPARATLTAVLQERLRALEPGAG
jgi:diadenosine tetraphosphate (Ap4A) HIT family hydrolase